MTSRIQTSMNNIDRMYTSDPVEFARGYLGTCRRFCGESIRLKSDDLSARCSTRANERHDFLIGNGGSAATASHFANDCRSTTNTTSHFGIQPDGQRADTHGNWQ